MNKVVRSHYPVERLPLDLREIIGDGRTVTVTLELEDMPTSRPTATETLAAMQAERDRLTVSDASDPVARIRKLRDEWED